MNDSWAQVLGILLILAKLADHFVTTLERLSTLKHFGLLGAVLGALAALGHIVNRPRD